MMVEKTIPVPAGKLRLQIETNTELGPTVSEVQSDSPLVGQVLVGDIILSINSTDTRSMTGQAVARLFVDTASENDRTMVILRHSSRNASTSDVVTSTTVNKSVPLQEATLTVPKRTPRSPNSAVVEQKSKTFGEENVSYDDNGMVEINIIAPPGRLGLFLETTKDGLQIVKIRPESPLHGIVRVGDIMLSVNGIYCRTMTAFKITQLLTG
jgi:C-terminal processing protease CtpA/Prc